MKIKKLNEDIQHCWFGYYLDIKGNKKYVYITKDKAGKDPDEASDYMEDSIPEPFTKFVFQGSVANTQAEKQGFKFLEQLQAEDEDGWGDDIEETLGEVFDKMQEIQYEVNHCVRGSYGVSGDKVENLVAELQEVRDMLEDKISYLEHNTDSLNEGKSDNKITEIVKAFKAAKTEDEFNAVKSDMKDYINKGIPIKDEIELMNAHRKAGIRLGLISKKLQKIGNDGKLIKESFEDDSVQKFLNTSVKDLRNDLQLVKSAANAFLDEYKKLPQGMDATTPDADEAYRQFADMYYDFAKKCQEVCKSQEFNASGYGQDDYFILKCRDLCKRVDYLFPYGYVSRSRKNKVSESDSKGYDYVNAKSLQEELWDKSRVSDLVTYYLDRSNVPVNTLGNLIKSQMEKEGSKLPYNVTDFYDELYIAIDRYNSQFEESLNEGIQPADEWFLKQYPEDIEGAEELKGLFIDDVIKDKGNLEKYGFSDRVKEILNKLFTRYFPMVTEATESATHCVYFTQDGKDQVEFKGTEDECNKYIKDIQAEQDDEYGDEAPERFVKKVNEAKQYVTFGAKSKKLTEAEIFGKQIIRVGDVLESKSGHKIIIDNISVMFAPGEPQGVPTFHYTYQTTNGKIGKSTCSTFDLQNMLNESKGSLSEAITKDTLVQYQFPLLTDEDKKYLKRYGLQLDDETDEDSFVSGRYEDVAYFANNYLGYSLVKGYLKELDESLTEDVDVDTLKGPKEGPEYGLASLLNTAIQEEFKTIESYNSLALTARDEGFIDIADVIDEINTEENKHVGQLEGLLKTVSENAEAIDAGSLEVGRQVNVTESFDDTDFELASEFGISEDDDISELEMQEALDAIKKLNEDANNSTNIPNNTNDVNINDIEEEVVDMREAWEDIYDSFKKIETDLNGDGEAITATIDKLYQDNKGNPDFKKAYDKWASGN